MHTKHLLNPKLYQGVRIILLLLLVIVSYYVAVPISRALLFYPKNTLFPKIVVGLKIKELDDSEITATEALQAGLDNTATEQTNHIEIPKWQRDYYSKFEVPLVIISLDYIYIPSTPGLPHQKICVKALSIRHSVPDKKRSTESRLLLTTQPVCLNQGMNYFISDASELKSVIYNSYLDSFWYPFDYRTLDFEIKMDGYTTGVERNYPDLVFDVTTIPARWVSWKIYPASQQKLDYQSTRLGIILTRPLLYPLLSILVPFTVFMLLVKILPNVVRERGSFWEITVGLTLGLWSFSEVLIPSYINFPTLIGYVILLLYIPLVRFIYSISWSYRRDLRKEPRTREQKQRKRNRNA